MAKIRRTRSNKRLKDRIGSIIHRRLNDSRETLLRETLLQIAIEFQISYPDIQDAEFALWAKYKKFTKEYKLGLFWNLYHAYIDHPEFELRDNLTSRWVEIEDFNKMINERFKFFDVSKYLQEFPIEIAVHPSLPRPEKAKNALVLFLFAPPSQTSLKEPLQIKNDYDEIVFVSKECIVLVVPNDITSLDLQTWIHDKVGMLDDEHGNLACMLNQNHPYAPLKDQTRILEPGASLFHQRILSSSTVFAIKQHYFPPTEEHRQKIRNYFLERFKSWEFPSGFFEEQSMEEYIRDMENELFESGKYDFDRYLAASAFKALDFLCWLNPKESHSIKEFGQTFIENPNPLDLMIIKPPDYQEDRFCCIRYLNQCLEYSLLAPIKKFSQHQKDKDFILFYVDFNKTTGLQLKQLIRTTLRSTPSSLFRPPHMAVSSLFFVKNYDLVLVTDICNSDFRSIVVQDDLTLTQQKIFHHDTFRFVLKK